MKDQDLSHLIKGLYRAALTLIVIAMATGWYLGRNYSVLPEQIEPLRNEWRSQSLIGILARVHYWSSFGLLLTIPIALFFSIWSADWKQSMVRWYSGLGLFVVCLMLQITGNALPMDQHDARTVAVESALTARVPGVGTSVANVVRNGETAGIHTVQAWGDVHRMHLSATCGVLALVLLAGVLQKSANVKQGKTELVLWAIPVIGVLLTSFAVPAPSGSLATTADFASNNALPSWYVLPMHAMLLFFDSLYRGAGWFGMAVIPAFVGIAVILLPWWARKMPVGGRRAVLIGGALTPAILIALYAGKPAPITGSQDLEEVVSAKAEEPIDTTLAEKGAVIFNMDCAGCHGPKGEGSNFAPSVQGARKKGHDRMWIMQFVKAPQSVRSGSTMPAQTQLSESQLEAVAEYVRSMP